jgi:hypothetical protein
VYVFGTFSQYLKDSGGNVVLSGVLGAVASGFLLAFAKSDLKLVWALPFTAAMGCTPLSVAVDPAGGIVVGGFFSGGSAMIGTTVSVPAKAGANSAFVARVAKDGSVLSAIGDATGVSSDVVGVAADATGAIYIAGAYVGTLTMNGLVLAGDASATRAYLATLDANLSPKASLSLTPTATGMAPAALLEHIVPGCSMITAGLLEESVALSPKMQLTGAPDAIFVAAYDPSLSTPAWAVAMPSPDAFGPLNVRGLSVDAASRAVYLSGNYASSITIGGTHMAAAGDAGASFVVKLQAP